jgi:hypothetical protein
MTSKDNDRLYKDFREFFDRPVNYSPKKVLDEGK